MNPAPLTIINLKQEADTEAAYKNVMLSAVNDHVVRISVMTEDFYWHYHANSDETFLVTEGVLLIDLEDRTIELSAGELFAIPKNVIHRTRPKGERSVNVTFESMDMETIKVER
ncbi:cupin domain-containing protein [Mucilaginibacter gilvus]|uniref:Cupin domain-containing protein n=1 Tax=Mucilaginibacter gilvus TaxID=2305909 RepID=A0A3S3UP37_9SPHI|nr:cupin domain-containing protein [Mucilaginibacter gilvus]RWY50980.1 cupin domain-containing protein [Mucilaginibacter gilvus]